MRENPVISDRVRESGGSTEGTLGRWLAQRQAALRELLAAGARSTLLRVFRVVPLSTQHLACHTFVPALERGQK